MKLLLAPTGHIIGGGQSITFGVWEELDMINGISVCKWKFEDEDENTTMYALDGSLDAAINDGEPVFHVVEVESIPDDCFTDKYLYVDGEFIDNPDYVEPPKTLEELQEENEQLKKQIETHKIEQALTELDIDERLINIELGLL